MALGRGAAVALAFALLLGCDDEPSQDEVAGETAGEAETTVEDVAEDIPPPEDPGQEIACAQALVVAWEGAEYASDDVTRTKEEARAKAEELLGLLEEGADFAELAKEESDAASTAPRGGLVGTYVRTEWPGPYAPIEDTVFDLAEHQTSQVVEAPFGWVIAKRCPVEMAHTRHVLIRYEGAEGAPEDLERTEEEARALAAQVHNEATAEGADFEAIARDKSEDDSAERGGDMGVLGRGRMVTAYEEAAFALSPGEISEPVETEYGFHVIQRVE